MTLKKTFLSLLALITMGGSAMADDKPVITVDDIEALPGETVSFYVNLSGGKDNTYKGMALYVYSEQTGFSLTDVSVASEWGATPAVGVINPAVGDPSISITSSKALPSGTVDDLLEVSLTVDNSVALGEYVIRLEKTALRYFDALDNPCEDIADDITFTVKVVSVHTIVLDELATAAPTTATGVNVRVKRSIKANSWSTICLPFAMTAEQVQSAFGAGVLLKDFTGAEATIEDDNVVRITVNFTEVTAIDANHPYLIKVASAVSEFTVDGVDINPDEEVSVDKDEYRTGSGTKKDPYVYHYNSFVGTYVAQTEVPELCLFISNDKFYYSNGSTKMKAFRGYFDFYDVLTAVEQGASARINMIDVEPTGIANAKVNLNTNDSYFNLAGQKVQNPKKGLYIKNNKKVVLK